MSGRLVQQNTEVIGERMSGRVVKKHRSHRRQDVRQGGPKKQKVQETGGQVGRSQKHRSQRRQDFRQGGPKNTKIMGDTMLGRVVQKHRSNKRQKNIGERISGREGQVGRQVGREQRHEFRQGCHKNTEVIGDTISGRVVQKNAEVIGDRMSGRVVQKHKSHRRQDFGKHGSKTQKSQEI